MWIVIGLFLICAWLVWPGKRRARNESKPLFVRTGSHWRRNYGRRSFLRLGGAVAAAGLLAWTGADEACDSFHSDVVRSRATDRSAGVVKYLGERFWFLNWGLLDSVSLPANVCVVCSKLCALGGSVAKEFI